MRRHNRVKPEPRVTTNPSPASMTPPSPPPSGSSSESASASRGLTRTRTRNPWVLYAMASGACAAFNGVFAKLTTTSLTSTLSSSIAHLLHLPGYHNAFEVLIRGIFFALNLTFNGIMWTLFTKALAKGTSTTQVSVLNTGTNFVITALLGLVIFSEALPPMWWAGAGLLVVGNVVVGRKDEGERKEVGEGGEQSEAVPLMQNSNENQDEDEGQDQDQDQDRDRDERGEEAEDEDVADLGDLSGAGVGSGVAR
ncbi:hypothetical protein E4U09_006935 [Claviceps aff. purpurea]|uniref:Transmembrane protein 42 n=1 Tax=Claviceps aff. purpurea TaxID=1967640 RepID=A0A9P7QC42_9HYPO|nr:hypothetical protein E4U09_006935 [Claviceps aff. purpurea]